MAADDLRERTRRAVRAELSEAAQDLFLEQGYEATTIDQIATAVGLSRRSFFRYFASKEDLVIGKYELNNEDMIDRLRERPAGESVWTSLRYVFEAAIRYYTDPHLRARASTMQAIVNDSPTLRGAQLAQFSVLQDRLVEELASRAGSVTGKSDIALRAVVGAGFACLQVALTSAPETDDPAVLGRHIDEAMAAVRSLDR